MFRLLFRTIELLWNLLEHGDPQQISDQLNSRVTISLLQEAFFGQVTQSHSQYHRQLRFDNDLINFFSSSTFRSFRNDILVVCYLIISLKPDAPVVETGFAKQLLLFASYPERKSFFFHFSDRIDSSSFVSVRSNSPLVKNFKLTTSQEDFEFKKLLFNTVVALSRNPAMFEVKRNFSSFVFLLIDRRFVLS